MRDTCLRGLLFATRGDLRLFSSWGENVKRDRLLVEPIPLAYLVNVSIANILAPASLHRRIVVAYRLRRLGSANSLLWAVSLRQKQHSVVFNLLHVILEDFLLPIREAFL